MIWLVIGGVAASLVLLGIILHRHFRSAPPTCDLRRTIAIVGGDQNSQNCIAQRRALKPLLMQVRAANINVLEVYGKTVPRRNGRPLDWADNRALRKELDASVGFHFLCIDDQGDVALRVRMPVSATVIEEMIADEARRALPPPPSSGPRPTPPGGPGPKPTQKGKPAAKQPPSPPQKPPHPSDKPNGSGVEGETQQAPPDAPRRTGLVAPKRGATSSIGILR